MAVSEIRINLNALRHNMRVIREHLPKEVNVLAVVKANAYGHGAVQALRIALEEGYCAAAVARVEEGAELREAGFTCPIYVLGLPLAEDMPTAVNNDLIVPVDDTVDLDAYEAVAAAAGKVMDVWIAVDTGMNRIGVHPADVPALWDKLESLSYLHIRGAFTHMATADHKEKDAALAQLDRFDEALSHMKITEDFRRLLCEQCRRHRHPAELAQSGAPGHHPLRPAAVGRDDEHAPSGIRHVPRVSRDSCADAP